MSGRYTDYSQLTTPQLWQEFRKTIAVTAKAIRQLAAIVHELTERGEKVPVSSEFSLLEEIYKGKLNANVYLCFLGKVEVLRLIAANLVEEEQIKLIADNVLLPVLTRNDKGGELVENVRPVALLVSQARQLFAEGHIRSVAEQRKVLPPPRTPAKAPTAMPAEREGHQDIQERLDTLADQIEDTFALPQTRQPRGIWLDLTSDEIERLQAFAAATDTDATGAVRRLLEMGEQAFRLTGRSLGPSAAQ